MYRTVQESELKKFGKTWSVSVQAIALVNQQKAAWPLAGSNYRALKNIKESVFDFGHFRVKYQFNPERIRSSAANTHPEAILARPCFLCPGNLPPEQVGIPVPGHFIILVNPYPIFPRHLTIPSTVHTPQILTGNIDTILNISKILNDFVVFYNGSRCGASAPDHLHFQAGNKGVLPLDEEMEVLLTDHSECLLSEGTTRVYAVENYLRRFIAFRSASAESLSEHLSAIISLLPSEPGEEPMINLLVWYEASVWTAALFPRAKQRPWQYYAGDFEQLVISPAAVELGGLVVLPREEDYFKLTPKDLISVFEQVSIGKEDFESLKMNVVRSAPGT